MAPPTSLPPLRPPLPSLQFHRQRVRGEISIPPLRWRHEQRVVSETVDVGVKKREREHDHKESEATTTKKANPKAERDELADQVRVLTEVVASLRRRAGLPTEDDTMAVERVETTNQTIQASIHASNSKLGRLHSMVRNELLLPTVNPMSTFMHLPKDMAQRRAILRGIQDLKLRRAAEFATSWLCHLDHSQPYTSQETFTSATGEYHFHRGVIAQLPNFQTARQLYDVFVDFMANLDANVTDMLGQITMREETEDFDPLIWHHRFVTVTEDVGCVEELNVVGFAKFFEQSPYTNSSMGVIVRDSVNVDELFPYLPDERTCKDLQCVSLMYELPIPGTDETVVVFKDCTFVVQLMPMIPLAPHRIRQLQANTDRWPKTYLKFLKEYVVPGASTRPEGDHPHGASPDRR